MPQIPCYPIDMDFLSFLVWILLSGAAMHLFLSHVARNKKKLPPGPNPLPIVGNLFQLGSRPHESLAELAKIHGPVMRLQLGRRRTVVISSAPMAKQALHKNDASVCSRVVPDCLTLLQHHELSFIGERWKSWRRISNSHLFTRSRLDSMGFLRRKKVEDLVSYIKLQSRAGEAVDIGHVAFNTAINLLSNTFFSVDLAELNSSFSREFKEVFSDMMVEAAKANMADFYPVLKWIDPQGIRRRMGAHLKKMIDIFSSIISQRLAHGKQDDVLDGLLNICHEKNEQLELHHIPHFLLDLFLAGTDSTTHTIEWAMTELLGNPSKMNKAREELERVVGKGIPIKEEDIPNLPYLQAVIKETFRKDGPVPFINRKAESDIEFSGFTVPKNTPILINLWAIGTDPSLWQNPGSFEPERFLGTEIDVKGRDFELIPFGAGRRICPAFTLAMRMIPLMLGSLINCFEWKLEGETMDMDAKFGLTLQKAQPLRAIPISVM